MMNAYECGNVAGYLIHFYEKQTILFLPVQDIEDIKRAGHKSVTWDMSFLAHQEDSEPINFSRLLL